MEYVRLWKVLGDKIEEVAATKLNLEERIETGCNRTSP